MLETVGDQPEVFLDDARVIFSGHPGWNIIKLFNFVTDAFEICFAAFVPGKPFQPSLIFATGNTKGGSITVPLISCLTGLESAKKCVGLDISFHLQNW